MDDGGGEARGGGGGDLKVEKVFEEFEFLGGIKGYYGVGRKGGGGRGRKEGRKEGGGRVFFSQC